MDTGALLAMEVLQVDDLDGVSEEFLVVCRDIAEAHAETDDEEARAFWLRTARLAAYLEIGRIRACR